MFMNYGYMVIYQKNNNDLIYRANKTRPAYNIGDKTSMGWKVIDIQRLHNGKCYSMNEFDKKLSVKHPHYLLYFINILQTVCASSFGTQIIPISILFSFTNFSESLKSFCCFLFLLKIYPHFINSGDIYGK